MNYTGDEGGVVVSFHVAVMNADRLLSQLERDVLDELSRHTLERCVERNVRVMQEGLVNSARIGEYARVMARFSEYKGD